MRVSSPALLLFPLGLCLCESGVSHKMVEDAGKHENSGHKTHLKIIQDVIKDLIIISESLHLLHYIILS